MPAVEASVLSAPDVAKRFGVPYHTAITVLDRLGIVEKIGRNRAIHAVDLPMVEAALKGGGFIERHQNKGA